MADITSIAVISDIHGNSWALEAVLENVKKRGVSKIVNLGDCLYGPLDPSGTADILMELNIPTVSGNEDRIIIDKENSQESPTLEFVRENLRTEQKKWLENLPFSMTAYNDAILFHGTLESDMEYLLLDVQKTGLSLRNSTALGDKLNSVTNKLILCGHDHTPNAVLLGDGRMIVNPGSVGLQAYTDHHPYPHFIETGSHHARYSVIHHLNEGYLIKNILVPYDWETASKTAIQNGRHDWAHWLKTGRAR